MTVLIRGGDIIVMRQGGGRGGVKRSTASQVRHLEVGWNGRVFKGTIRHRGRGVPCYKPIQGV